MRALTLAVIGAGLLCAIPAAPVRSAEPGASSAALATDFSSATKHSAKNSAKRRNRVVRTEAAPRYRHGPGTIACTHGGCVTVPPGCHAIRERTVDDSPSGFQIIIC